MSKENKEILHVFEVIDKDGKTQLHLAPNIDNLLYSLQRNNIKSMRDLGEVDLSASDEVNNSFRLNECAEKIKPGQFYRIDNDDSDTNNVLKRGFVLAEKFSEKYNELSLLFCVLEEKNRTFFVKEVNREDNVRVEEGDVTCISHVHRTLRVVPSFVFTPISLKDIDEMIPLIKRAADVLDEYDSTHVSIRCKSRRKYPRPRKGKKQAHDTASCNSKNPKGNSSKKVGNANHFDNN